MLDLEDLLISQPGLEEFASLAYKGVPRKLVDELASALALKRADLALSLRISERTLGRYRSDQLLSVTVSEQVLWFVRVFVRAIEIFEDRDKAARWMTSKSRALNGVPLELMKTAFGAERVMDSLGRIEHGVYS